MQKKRIELICNKTIEWAFFALLFLVPLYFDTSVRGVFDVPKVCIMRWCSLIIIGAWLIRMILIQQWRFVRTKLDWSVWFFLVISILATIFAFDPYVSLIGAYKRHEGLTTTISYILIFFVSTNFLTDRKMISRALYVAILSGIVGSLYTVIQTMGLDPISWEGNVTSSGRAVGTFGNPIFLGSYMATIIPIALGIFFGYGKQNIKDAFKKKIKKKEVNLTLKENEWIDWALVIGIILMYAALFFAASRGPLLGFMIGLITLFFSTYRIIGIGLIPIYAILILVPGGGIFLACIAGIISIFVIFMLLKRIETEKRIKIGLILSAFFIITLWTGFKASSVGGRVINTIEGGVTGKAAERLPAELGGKIDKDEDIEPLSPAKKLNRLETILAGLFGNRYWIWKTTCLIAYKYPQNGNNYGPLTFPYCGLILGTGLDTLKWVYPLYEPPGMEKLEGSNVDYDRAHNETFDTLAAKGLVGVFSYLWLLAAFAFFWWKGYKKIEQRDKPIMLGLLTGWIAYIVQNQFAFPVASFTPLFWLIMGVTMRFSNQISEMQPTAESKEKQTIYLTPLQSGLSFVVIGIVVVLVILAFFPYRADYYFNKGEKAVHDGNIDLAIEMYEKAVSWNPRERHYYGELTFSYYKKAAAISAETQIEKKKEWVNKTINRIGDAFKVNKEDGYFYNILGAAYALSFDVGSATAKEKAIDSYKKALRYNIIFAEPHNNLAALYSKLNEYDKAIEQYKQVLRILPKDTQCMNTIGDIYFRKGDINSAILWLKKALSIDPNLINVHHRLGEICFNQGKYDDSIQAFKKILLINPNGIEVYRDLGAAYFRAGMIKEAKESFEIYLRSYPQDNDIRAIVNSM